MTIEWSRYVSSNRVGAWWHARIGGETCGVARRRIPEWQSKNRILETRITPPEYDYCTYCAKRARVALTLP